MTKFISFEKALAFLLKLFAIMGILTIILPFTPIVKDYNANMPIVQSLGIIVLITSSMGLFMRELTLGVMKFFWGIIILSLPKKFSLARR